MRLLAGRAAQEDTSYAYQESEGCAIRTPGSCRTFASVLSLQVCSSNSAQAVQQLLSSSAFVNGTGKLPPLKLPAVH